jgi:hypothetical protein
MKYAPCMHAQALDMRQHYVKNGRISATVIGLSILHKVCKSCNQCGLLFIGRCRDSAPLGYSVVQNLRQCPPLKQGSSACDSNDTSVSLVRLARVQSQHRIEEAAIRSFILFAHQLRQSDTTQHLPVESCCQSARSMCTNVR